MDRLVIPRPGARLAAILATLVVVALGVVLGLVDGADGAPTYPPVRPTRVLVLGDSVMKGAATDYAAKLPGRDVVVDAEVNRTTGQGVAVLDRQGTDWDVVVILLGHNDGGSPGAYQPAARQILDRLRGVRHVVWLKIHEVRPYYPTVNQYIDGLRAEYPNLSTADWNSVANANPGALAGDGLHLNGQGADLMANLVAQQVNLAELEWHGALVRLATTTTSTTSTTTTTAPPTTTSTSTSTTTTAAATTTNATAARADASKADAAPACGTGDGAGCTTGAASNGTIEAAAGGVVAVAVIGLGVWAVVRARRRRRIPFD